MALLLNTNKISKSFGAAPLFRDISLSIQEGDRLGLIGPNGSGKSTLLEILAGRIEPDSGDLVLRSGTRLAYVPQDSNFEPGETIRGVMRRARCAPSACPNRNGRLAKPKPWAAPASAISMPQPKRFPAAGASGSPSPKLWCRSRRSSCSTNPPITWIWPASSGWRKSLQGAPFACVIVSHDRYFLENVPTRLAELNRVYPDGLFYVAGNYSAFLEEKGEFLHAQAQHQSALENRVRIEMEWLRRGPKARATKAKARIDNAGELIAELADLKLPKPHGDANFDFVATGRKTKRLVHLENVGFGFEGKPLFDNLTFTITAGMRVGLVGANGSGKTTLLQLLRGDLAPLQGKIERADNLRIVYFDQRRQIDPDLTLRRALAPDSDSVIYRDRVIHVASWAARFLFASEQLDQPVRQAIGRRAGPRTDRQPDAGPRRPAASRRAHQRSRYSHARDPGGEPARIPGRAGAGDARSLSAGSRLDHRAGSRRQRQSPSLRRLLAMGSRPSCAPTRRNQKPSTPRVPAASTQKKKLSYLESREYESIEERIARLRRRPSRQAHVG